MGLTVIAIKEHTIKDHWLLIPFKVNALSAIQAVKYAVLLLIIAIISVMEIQEHVGTQITQEVAQGSVNVLMVYFWRNQMFVQIAITQNAEIVEINKVTTAFIVEAAEFYCMIHQKTP